MSKLNQSMYHVNHAWKTTNGGLSQEVESLKNAIDSKHTINGQETTNGDKYALKSLDTFNRVFALLKWDNNKEYDSTDIDTFIIDNYVNMTKGIIKGMTTKVFKLKNGDYTVSPCYESAKNIVNRGYNDTIFPDLCQEVALIMLENKDNIIYDNDTKSFDCKDIALDCYKAVQTYLYRNKQRVDNKEVSIIGYDESGDECVSIAVNSIDFRRYAVKEYNEITTDYESMLTICHSVLYDINRTQKPFIAEKCKKVLVGLMSGLTVNEIHLKYDIPLRSISNYRNILSDTFYKLYRKPDTLHDTISDNWEVSHNRFAIDFKGLKGVIDNNSHDTVLNRVNAYYHDVKQAFYNDLFGVPTKSRINDLEHAEEIVYNYIYTGHYGNTVYNDIQVIINR